MKLYTEFELKRAMDLFLSPIRPLKSQVIQQLTPIELPSDEEIEKAAIKIVNKHCDSPSGDLTVEVECFEAGVYWMKEQILNQNKKETLEEWKARFTHHCAIKAKNK